MNMGWLIPLVGIKVEPIRADAKNRGHSVSLTGGAGPVAVAIHDNGVSSDSASEIFNLDGDVGHGRGEGL